MNSSGSSGPYTPNPQYEQRFFTKSRSFNSRKRAQKARPHHNSAPYANIRDRRFYRHRGGFRGAHNAAARQTPPPGSSDAMQRIVQKTSSFLIRELEASTDGEIVLPSTLRPQDVDTNAVSEENAVTKAQSVKQISNKQHAKTQGECLSEKDFIAKFDEIFAKLNAKQKRRVVNNGSHTSGLKFYKTAVLRELKNVSHKKVELQQCRVANEIMPELVMELRHQSREFIAKLSETLGNSIEMDDVVIADSSDKEDVVEDVDARRKKRHVVVAPPPAPKVTAEELETQRCAMTESRHINVIHSESSSKKFDVQNIRFEIVFDQERAKATSNAMYDEYSASFEDNSKALVKTEPSSLDDESTTSDVDEQSSRRKENATLRKLRKKYEGCSDVDSDASSIVLERFGSECGSDHLSDTEYNPNIVKKEGSIIPDGQEDEEEEEEVIEEEESGDEVKSPGGGVESNPADVSFKEEGSEEETTEVSYKPTVITIIGPSGGATTAKLLPQTTEARDENYWRDRYVKYEERTRRMLEELKAIDDACVKQRRRVFEEFDAWRASALESQPSSSSTQLIPQVTLSTPTTSLPPLKTLRFTIAENNNRNASLSEDQQSAKQDSSLNEPSTSVKTMRYSFSEDDVKRRNPVINALEGNSPNDSRIHETPRMSSSPTDFTSITDLFSFPSAVETGVVSKSDDMEDSNRIIDALNNYGDLTFPDILTAGDAAFTHSTEKSAVDFPNCNNIKVERNDDTILTYFQLRHNHQQSHPATVHFRDWSDSILVIKVYGNEVITGSDSGFLSYFHIDTGNLIQTIRLSANAITSIIILETDKDVLLYIGSLDGNLHIVNFRLRKCMRKLPIKLPIQCLEIAWNTIFIGTSEGEVIRYLYRQNGLKQSNKIADSGILAINTGMDGARHVLIVAIRDAAVSICDALSGMTLRVIGDQLNPTVYSMLFYNNRIYCGTSQHNVLVYNYHDAQLMFRHQESQGSGIPCIKRLQHLLFVGCYNRQIYVYNMKNNSLIASITGPEGLLLSMEVTEHKIIVSTKEHFQCLPLPTSVLALL